MTIKLPSPFPKDTKIQIASPEDEFENKKLPESQYAINLITKIETPVQAIQDGIIFKVKTDSKKCSLDKKLTNQANYIVIDHGDETYSEYSHLGTKTPIRVGQKIKTGETIGYTGFSGYMKTPNLYLNIFKIEKGKPVSLPFEIKKPKTQEDIAKIAGMILILTLAGITFIFSRITGNTIGEKTSNPYAIILIILALISGTTWIALKRKQHKP